MPDLRALQRAGAAFVPAVQPNYVGFARPRNTPLRAGLSRSDFNLLMPNPLNQLEIILASAACFPRYHPGSFIERENRPNGTTLMMDSGGFSLIFTGRIPSPLAVELLVRRQEEVADVAFTLDVPTQCLKVGHPVYKNFDDCLRETMDFLRRYDRARDYSKPLITLNILQGVTEPQRDAWYNSVKQFPHTGWAIAGKPKPTWSNVLRRLLVMMNDKALDSAKWLHVLGMATNEVPVVLTAIQDGLRQVLNRPHFMATYDDARCAVGLARSHLFWINDPLRGVQFPDSEAYVGSREPAWLLDSPVGRRLTMGDLCVQKGKKSTWNGFTLACLENHNMYVRVAAYGRAAALSKLTRRSDRLTAVQEHLLALRDVIIQILITQDYGLLRKWAPFLDAPDKFDGRHILIREWREAYGLATSNF